MEKQQKKLDDEETVEMFKYNIVKQSQSEQAYRDVRFQDNLKLALLTL